MELPALMYVSEVALGPLRITPVTEATNARKSVAFSDLIASKPAPVLPFQSKASRVLNLEIVAAGGSRTKLAYSHFLWRREHVLRAKSALSRTA